MATPREGESLGLVSPVGKVEMPLLEVLTGDVDLGDVIVSLKHEFGSCVLKNNADVALRVDMHSTVHSLGFQQSNENFREDAIIPDHDTATSPTDVTEDQRHDRYNLNLLFNYVNLVKTIEIPAKSTKTIVLSYRPEIPKANPQQVATGAAPGLITDFKETGDIVFNAGTEDGRSARVKIKFSCRCCASVLELQTENGAICTELDFGTLSHTSKEVSSVQDFTIINKSNVPVQFMIQVVKGSSSLGFTFTFADTSEAVLDRSIVLDAHLFRRVQVHVSPLKLDAAGEHVIILAVENLSDQTCHYISVCASISNAVEETRPVIDINLPAGKSFLDFGSCYGGKTVYQKMELKNQSLRPCRVSFDHESDDSRDKAKGTLGVRAYETRVSQANQTSSSKRGSTHHAHTNHTHDDLCDMVVKPGATQWVEVCYTPDLSTDRKYDKLQSIKFRLFARTTIIEEGEEAEQHSNMNEAAERKPNYYKTISCRAMVCTSRVEVMEKTIDFGDSKIGEKASCYVSIVNPTQLPAELSIEYDSKIMSAACGKRVLVRENTAAQLEFQIVPHKVNPSFSKQVFVRNCNNARDIAVINVSSNNIDSAASINALYYSLTYLHENKSSSSSKERESSSGVISRNPVKESQLYRSGVSVEVAIGFPSLRGFAVKNKRSTKLVLGLEVSRPSWMGIYVSTNIGGGDKLLPAAKEGYLKMLPERDRADELAYIEHIQQLKQNLEEAIATSNILLTQEVVLEPEGEPGSETVFYILFMIPSCDKESLAKRGSRDETLKISVKNQESQIGERIIPICLQLGVSSFEIGQQNINLGSLGMGEKKTKTVPVTNTSSLPLLFQATLSHSMESTQLKIESSRDHQYSGLIRPFARRSIELQFTPSQKGKFNEKLTFTNILDPAVTRTLVIKAEVNKIDTFEIKPSVMDLGVVHFRDRPSPTPLPEEHSAPSSVGVVKTKFTVNNIGKAPREYLISTRSPLTQLGVTMTVDLDIETVRAQAVLSSSIEEEIEKLEQQIKGLMRKKKEESVLRMGKRIEKLKRLHASGQTTTEDGDLSSDDESTPRNAERVHFSDQSGKTSYRTRSTPTGGTLSIAVVVHIMRYASPDVRSPSALKLPIDHPEEVSLDFNISETRDKEVQQSARITFRLNDAGGKSLPFGSSSQTSSKGDKEETQPLILSADEGEVQVQSTSDGEERDAADRRLPCSTPPALDRTPPPSAVLQETDSVSLRDIVPLSPETLKGVILDEDPCTDLTRRFSTASGDEDVPATPALPASSKSPTPVQPTSPCSLKAASPLPSLAVPSFPACEEEDEVRMETTATPSAGVLELSTTLLDFGKVRIGETRCKTLDLRALHAPVGYVILQHKRVGGVYATDPPEVSDASTAEGKDEEEEEGIIFPEGRPHQSTVNAPPQSSSWPTPAMQAAKDAVVKVDQKNGRVEPGCPQVLTFSITPLCGKLQKYALEVKSLASNVMLRITIKVCGVATNHVEVSPQQLNFETLHLATKQQVDRYGAKEPDRKMMSVKLRNVMPEPVTLSLSSTHPAQCAVYRYVVKSEPGQNNELRTLHLEPGEQVSVYVFLYPRLERARLMRGECRRLVGSVFIRSVGNVSGVVSRQDLPFKCMVGCVVMSVPGPHVVDLGRQIRDSGDDRQNIQDAKGYFRVFNKNRELPLLLSVSSSSETTIRVDPTEAEVAPNSFVDVRYVMTPRDTGLTQEHIMFRNVSSFQAQVKKTLLMFVDTNYVRIGGSADLTPATASQPATLKLAPLPICPLTMETQLRASFANIPRTVESPGARGDREDGFHMPPRSATTSRTSAAMSSYTDIRSTFATDVSTGRVSCIIENRSSADVWLLPKCDTHGFVPSDPNTLVSCLHVYTACAKYPKVAAAAGSPLTQNPQQMPGSASGATRQTQHYVSRGVTWKDAGNCFKLPKDRSVTVFVEPSCVPLETLQRDLKKLNHARPVSLTCRVAFYVHQVEKTNFHSTGLFLSQGKVAQMLHVAMEVCVPKVEFDQKQISLGKMAGTEKLPFNIGLVNKSGIEAAVEILTPPNLLWEVCPVQTSCSFPAIRSDFESLPGLLKPIASAPGYLGEAKQKQGGLLGSPLRSPAPKPLMHSAQLKFTQSPNLCGMQTLTPTLTPPVVESRCCPHLFMQSVAEVIQVPPAICIPEVEEEKPEEEDDIARHDTSADSDSRASGSGKPALKSPVLCCAPLSLSRTVRVPADTTLSIHCVLTPTDHRDTSLQNLQCKMQCTNSYNAANTDTLLIEADLERNIWVFESAHLMMHHAEEGNPETPLVLDSMLKVGPRESDGEFYRSDAKLTIRCLEPGTEAVPTRAHCTATTSPDMKDFLSISLLVLETSLAVASALEFQGEEATAALRVRCTPIPGRCISPHVAEIMWAQLLEVASGRQASTKGKEPINMHIQPDSGSWALERKESGAGSELDLASSETHTTLSYEAALELEKDHLKATLARPLHLGGLKVTSDGHATITKEIWGSVTQTPTFDTFSLKHLTLIESGKVNNERIFAGTFIVANILEAQNTLLLDVKTIVKERGQGVRCWVEGDEAVVIPPLGHYSIRVKAALSTGSDEDANNEVVLFIQDQRCVLSYAAITVWFSDPTHVAYEEVPPNTEAEHIDELMDVGDGKVKAADASEDTSSCEAEDEADATQPTQGSQTDSSSPTTDDEADSNEGVKPKRRKCRKSFSEREEGAEAHHPPFDSGTSWSDNDTRRRSSVAEKVVQEDLERLVLPRSTPHSRQNDGTLTPAEEDSTAHPTFKPIAGIGGSAKKEVRPLQGLSSSPDATQQQQLPQPEGDHKVSLSLPRGETQGQKEAVIPFASEKGAFSHDIEAAGGETPAISRHSGPSLVLHRCKQEGVGLYSLSMQPGKLGGVPPCSSLAVENVGSEPIDLRVDVVWLPNERKWLTVDRSSMRVNPREKVQIAFTASADEIGTLTTYVVFKYGNEMISVRCICDILSWGRAGKDCFDLILDGKQKGVESARDSRSAAGYELHLGDIFYGQSTSHHCFDIVNKSKMKLEFSHVIPKKDVQLDITLSLSLHVLKPFDKLTIEKNQSVRVYVWSSCTPPKKGIERAHLKSDKDDDTSDTFSGAVSDTFPSTNSAVQTPIQVPEANSMLPVPSDTPAQSGSPVTIEGEPNSKNVMNVEVMIRCRMVSEPKTIILQANCCRPHLRCSTESISVLGSDIFERERRDSDATSPHQPLPLSAYVPSGASTVTVTNLSNEEGVVDVRAGSTSIFSLPVLDTPSQSFLKTLPPKGSFELQILLDAAKLDVLRKNAHKDKVDSFVVEEHFVVYNRGLFKERRVCSIKRMANVNIT